MSQEFIEKLVNKGTVMLCAGSFCCEEMEEYIEKIEGHLEIVRGFTTKEHLETMFIQVEN